jgi:predicted RNA binding protein YcfA (HicA-like mRNA interferase family)
MRSLLWNSLTSVRGSATAQIGFGYAECVKVRDVLKTLHQDGWILKNQEGSHRQYVHPRKPGKVTIAGHPSDELDPKTRKSILKQAGLI